VKSCTVVGMLLVAGLSVTGCGRPDPQAQGFAATSQSQSSSPTASEAAELSRRAQAKAAAERENLARDRMQADMAAAQGAYDVAVAKAQSGHKAAIERCDSLVPNERKQCTAAADAQLALAMSQAEQLKPPT
jgi:hypothetical protein